MDVGGFRAPRAPADRLDDRPERLTRAFVVEPWTAKQQADSALRPRMTNGCTLIAGLGEADEAMERYVIICAQLRLSRSIGLGDRYVSQHPFTSEMSEVRVKSLGDGPSTTGSTTVWVPRLGDLAELHARELRLAERGRPAAWYRAAVLRAIADACERYPDATAEEAAARLFAERRRK